MSGDMSMHTWDKNYVEKITLPHVSRIRSLDKYFQNFNYDLELKR